MNLTCPECRTVYRVDPARVPQAGVSARCRECDAVFRVEADEPHRPGEVKTAPPVATPTAPVESATAPVESATVPGAPRQAGGVGAETTQPAAAEARPEPDVPTQPAAPAFGPQDPDTRARRLARALVSDIKVYNPEKWEESRREGRLRKEFRDEILKSWDEYVEQVGDQMAKKTPYFRDALNQILAGGESVF